MHGRLSEIKKALVRLFQGASIIEARSASPSQLSDPQSVKHPGPNATITDHIRFLLEAKEYVRNHPIPLERQGQNNQYSHAKRPAIHDNAEIPAITNCSYEYFGRKFISIGFPLFIAQAPLWKDGDVNYAFNNCTLWDSFEKVLMHKLGDLGDGSTKFGYYLPTNHSYIEKPVPEDVFKKAEFIIEFFTRTDTKDPDIFMKSLDLALQESQKSPLSYESAVTPPG
jgi:hypothetical protein